MSDSRVDGKWFREEDPMWAGYSVSLEIEKILFQESSEYQDILVFKRSVVFLFPLDLDLPRC